MDLEIFYIILTIFCTLFAACLGSFSNVVIYRVPNHLSIAWPPSTCPKCQNRIKPYDNIPVLSWLILRGKCRSCKNPISAQYPIIEAICAVLGFFLCRQVFGQNLDILLLDGVFLRLFALYAGMIIFLVGSLALAVIDYQTTEIPPEVALPIAALGIAVSFALPDAFPYATILGNITWLDSILGGLIGGGIIVAIIGGYYLLTKRIGMGGGDIWMMVMVGAFLGWQCLPFIFLAASVQGIIAAVIGILMGRKQQTETQNGLFRNAVVNEVEAELLADKSPKTTEASLNKEQNDNDTTKETASQQISDAQNSKINNSAEETANPESEEQTEHTVAASSSQNASETEEPSDGKLAIPFGPFIALAAIEYVFFGKWLLPIVSGGVLTPWGFVIF